MVTNNALTATILDEPMLLFGGGFPAVEPKSGISLYGPYSLAKNVIRVGIIGDKNTTSQVNAVLDRLKRPIEGPTADPLWTQDFPGMSLDSPFRCELQTSREWCQTIVSEDMRLLDKSAHSKRLISQSVQIFMKYLENITGREGGPDLVICAPPKQMMDLCATAEEARRMRLVSRPRNSQKHGRAKGFVPTQEYLFDYMPEVREDYRQLAFEKTADNFHHFLKARAMSLPIPTQLILPHTLDVYTLPNQKPMQDYATFAWNLSIGLLYKSGGRPWRPEQISAGTCFIGISFYREREIFGGQMATSVAQIFSPEGEALVLRGDRFPWTQLKSPRLTKDSAKKLLQKALSLYKQYVRITPSRVVVHKSSKYTSEEIAGLTEALNGIPQYDFLAIATRQKQIRFFRSGYHPIIRGTRIAFPNKMWLLYTKAYIPFLKLYPGPRVPLPLEILQHIGDSPPDTLNSEILALTKINWNSSDFCSMLPMTLEFSTRVGAVLRELPPGVKPEPQTKYLYYM